MVSGEFLFLACSHFSIFQAIFTCLIVVLSLGLSSFPVFRLPKILSLTMFMPCSRSLLRGEQIHSGLCHPPEQYNHLSPSFGLPRCTYLDLYKNEKLKETSSLKIICQLICEVHRTWVTNFAK